jgi:hypothetical protein
MTKKIAIALALFAFLVFASEARAQNAADPLSTAQELSASDRAAALVAMKTIAVPAVRAHMQFLSDSLLEGHEPGTRGYDIGAPRHLFSASFLREGA